MSAKRNLKAHSAWMERKRAGRPRQVWVDAEEHFPSMWAKVDEPLLGGAVELLEAIFGGGTSDGAA